jgi:F-type H+-transporting ATPase subunit epsilon
MEKLRYKVLTPAGVTEEGEGTALSAMTETGEITILPGHITLSTLLKPGEMRIKDGGRETSLMVSGGLLQVMPDNEIVILAEEAHKAENLVLEEIEEAKRRAEEALQTAKNKDETVFADAAAHLERELAKYRVALKGKGRQGGGE